MGTTDGELRLVGAAMAPTAERQDGRDKSVVHNYGHGGCGISLSLGCATKVQKIVRDHLGEHARGKRIAVIGAGVMGLTVATLLLELDLDLQISIYSHRDPLETTSAKAGGPWSVSGDEKGASGNEHLDQGPPARERQADGRVEGLRQDR